MNESFNHDQTVDLINALINESISGDDFATLNERLEQIPAARLLYIEMMNLHGELKHRFRLNQDADAAEHAREIESLLQESSLKDSPNLFPYVSTSLTVDPFGLSVTPASYGPINRWIPLVFGFVFLAFGLGFLWYQASVSPAYDVATQPLGLPRRVLEKLKQLDIQAEKDAVAVLTLDVAPQWSANSPTFRRGQSISQGMISLDSGLLQIDFFCGATMILEGPAKLEIVDAKTGYIHFGKLRAFVPEHARGFTIRSAQCDVLDLGTEFAMQVEPDGPVEVHVIDGEVQVSAPKNGAIVERLLKTGKAQRYAESGNVSDIEPKVDNFIGPSELKQIADRSLNTGFKNWLQATDELKSDPSLLAMFTFQESSSWDRSLVNSGNPNNEIVDGAIVGCYWTDGRWISKRALDFSKPSHRVRVDVPGVHDSLTMSAWINLRSLERDMAIAHSDTQQTNFLHWTLDKSPSDESMTLHLDVTDIVSGKPNREHYGSGELTGLGCFHAEDLGTWTHVAVTYDSVLGFVKHYKNGICVGQKKITHLQKMALGISNLGNWPYKEWARGTEFEVRNLVGKLDEFAVFSRVLSADEIAKISIVGRPEE